jgi:RsmE family RNA methyltransferase
MNLILLEPREVGEDGDVRLADSRAAHVIDVLKAGAGRAVRVGLLDGPRGSGVVIAISGKAVELRCEFEDEAPPLPRVDLLLALPRPKVMRRLWAQIAALGVGQIIVTNAARVERNYFDTHILSPGFYRPLLLEGLQQAGDTRLPAVSIHRQLKVLIEDELDRLFARGTRLVADPHEATSMRGELDQAAGGRMLIAVGPEGGWNTFERDLLTRHGFRCVSMGPRTLRTDTACLALLAIAHQA